NVSQGETPPYMNTSKMLFACTEAGSMTLAYSAGTSPKGSALARWGQSAVTPVAVAPPAAAARRKSRRFMRLSGQSCPNDGMTEPTNGALLVARPELHGS